MATNCDMAEPSISTWFEYRVNFAKNGRGNPVGPTGMSWSGFRPSDDACMYNYLVPSNMMAVVALETTVVVTALPTIAGELDRLDLYHRLYNSGRELCRAFGNSGWDS